MDGRVRWFLGFARNAGGYSLPMIGTPCEVPEPRKMKEKDILPAVSLRRRRGVPEIPSGRDGGGRTSVPPLLGLRAKPRQKTGYLWAGVRMGVDHKISFAQS